MPGTVATDTAPTVSLSFANNFWGKEDAGVQPVLERMHNAKVTSDELKSFFNARAAIEDEYSRKLLALARKPLGSNEVGTLRASLDVVRGETESMGKGHQNIAQQMKSELEEPLAAFAGGLKERRKIVQGGIEKLLKLKVSQTQTVNKSRDKYEQDCLRIKGYLAQGHMVMGQEERKNKAKLEKTQIQMANTSTDYEQAVKALEDTTGRWNRDWKAACDKFQDLEEERLDFTKTALWNFANIASTVCVSDDASCEKMRLSLEDCEVAKDIMSFINDRGTGQEIPDPPKFINFCRGDITDTASETSDDESYSVAQFQRIMNPAFRTSSPQPSTYESHHDPQSDLARSMGSSRDEPVAQSSRESTITPRKASQQPVPPPDYRRQAQMQSQAQNDTKPIPYNEHTSDGPTMFGRADNGQSDRSSNPSPVRPSSRDSASEYSNPTSLSSVEPLTSRTSLVKQSIEQNMPDLSPTKGLQKKRSGFFSNSPFRRKSKREAERPQSIAAPPAARSTWNTPSASTNSSPIKGTQVHDFARNTDPDLEPVDPRANFQLNVGQNVFDVASPDKKRTQIGNMRNPAIDQDDPIAAALAELKGVTKQSSTRQSADRYAGIATPAPGAQLAQNNPSPAMQGQRGTPPPGYHDPGMGVKRLGAPQAAHTSAAMQATTRKYTAQNNDMYGSNTRPGSGNSGGMNNRSQSPLPIRSTSPRPGYQQAPRPQGPPRREGPDSYTRSASPNPYAAVNAHPLHSSSPNPAAYSGRAPSPNPYANGAPHPRAASPNPAAYSGRAPSPNPYGANNLPRSASPNPYGANAWRPRESHSQSPQKSAPMNGGYGNAPRHHSPGDMRRAASPQPAFARQDRPSSAGMGVGIGAQGMALQLSQGAVGRPQSYYGGQQRPPPPGQDGRERSRSVVGGQQMTREGRPILHFARALYSYAAAIPEELTFAKGDTLSVLRLQDDGWWEAEVRGRGRPGLVPSNYLQAI